MDINSIFGDDPLSPQQIIKIKNSAKKRATRKKRLILETAMTDLEVINAKNSLDAGVVFGAYGPTDWISSSHLRKSINDKTSTLILGGTWITPAGWQFSDWVSSVSENFNFINLNTCIIFMPWGLIEASSSRNKLILELNGSPREVNAFIATLDVTMKRAENLIEWVYGARGESISVPLNYRKALTNAYPWLPKPLELYIDDYLNSHASVLILIGPPGTGKTTFIKNLIHQSGGDAKVTYDEKIMNDDSLFANFIESDTKFLIMEDADAFLAKREDGNTMMHRFLNVSDGLISAQDKKLVFSTNLPSIKDIDAALMRPGRCFDVIEFRLLTRDEALSITDGLQLELPDGNQFTLAELFNVQPSGEAKSISRKMGF
jgi:ATPase family associated with various cellular activities (AAA)